MKLLLTIASSMLLLSAPLSASNIVDELKPKSSSDEGANDVRALKTELLVKSTEVKAMAQINKLLKQKKGTSIEPELWFRLAELYMRQAKTNRFFELNKNNSRIKGLLGQTITNNSEKSSVKKAIEIYDSIEKHFPKYASLDLVLFNNGFANQSIANYPRAKLLFNRLVTKYPESYVIPDAYLSVGEMCFQDKDFDKALYYFQQIKKFPESRVYPYGLYKTAWTFYNKRDAKSGLVELETLVDFGVKVQKEGLDSRLDLRKEALEDMALFFEDVYPATRAFEYFKKPSGDFGVGPVLMRLTELYKSHSRYKDVAIVLHDLVKNTPRSVYVPTAYSELAHNYETMKDRVNSVSELEKFHTVCAANSDWQKALGKNELQDTDQGFSYTAEKDCRGIFDDTALRLASKWHRMWKKQPQFKELSVAAENAYRLYLDGTKPGENLNPARFNYAELLFQNEKFRLASENYAIVGDREVKDSKLRHDAAYGALVSLEKDVKDSWSDKDTLLFKDLASRYEKNNPNAKYLHNIKFKIGFIDFGANRFASAKKYFEEIGAQKENQDLAKKSQDMLMDIFNKEKSFSQLKGYTKSLMSKEADAQRKSKLNEIYQQSYFAEIQTLEDKGSLEKATIEYLKFTQENRTSPLASKAWWNAAQLYYKLGNYPEAAKQSFAFAQAYPEDKGAKEMLVRAAEAYEKTGRVAEAGDVIMELARRDKKEIKKWEIMAANFYSVSEKKDLARKLYDKYCSGTSKPDQELISRWYLMEKSMGNKGNVKKVQAIVFGSGLQPLSSQILLARLEEEMDKKDFKSAFNTAKSILSYGDSSAAYAKAMARFYQGMILEDELRSQSLKSKPERIAMVLQLKTQKLERVQNAYDSVVKMGFAKVGLMAMKRLGECYLHYAEAVRGIDIPAGAAPEDIKTFRAELEQLAMPMEDKGLQTLNAALNEAKKANLYSSMVEEIRNSLSKATNQDKPTYVIKVTPPGLVIPQIKESST